MRTVFAMVILMLTVPASAQNGPSIPDDFLAKMARDLATLQADPPPAAVAAGQGTTTLVPSRVRIDKDRATVWATDARPYGETQWHRGTEASVLNSVPGWYEVESNDGMFWVPSNDVAPTGPLKKISVAPDPGWLGQQIEKLMKNATAFRDAYSANPYLNVRGFSISLGLTPSVNVDFEFRRGAEGGNPGFAPRP